jgi:hypothetical protein
VLLFVEIILKVEMSRRNKNPPGQSNLPKKIDRTFSTYGDGLQEDHDCTSCSGRCEDYCRCSEIINAKVTSVDLEILFEKFSEFYSSYAKNATNKSIFNYCLYRLLVINKLYDTSSWEVETCRGYYGEEVEGISLIVEVYDTLTAQIESLNSSSKDDQIKLVLELEYGYVLDSLKDVSFEIVDSQKKDLVYGNEVYRKKVQKGTYKKHELPIGIYLEDGNKFRLIDGYHRFVDLASGSKDSDSFEIIVARNKE